MFSGLLFASLRQLSLSKNISNHKILISKSQSWPFHLRLNKNCKMVVLDRGKISVSGLYLSLILPTTSKVWLEKYPLYTLSLQAFTENESAEHDSFPLGRQTKQRRAVWWMLMPRKEVLGYKKMQLKFIQRTGNLSGLWNELLKRNAFWTYSISWCG